MILDILRLMTVISSIWGAFDAGLLLLSLVRKGRQESNSHNPTYIVLLLSFLFFLVFSIANLSIYVIFKDVEGITPFVRVISILLAQVFVLMLIRKFKRLNK